MNVWTTIRAQLSPARVVPIVLAIIGAAVTAATGYLAANGFNLDPAIVTGLVVPIALGFAASVLKWQNGWQTYEQTQGQRAEMTGLADVHPDDLVPDIDDLDSEKQKASEEHHHHHGKGHNR